MGIIEVTKAYTQYTYTIIPINERVEKLKRMSTGDCNQWPNNLNIRYSVDPKKRTALIAALEGLVRR